MDARLQLLYKRNKEEGEKKRMESQAGMHLTASQTVQLQPRKHIVEVPLWQCCHFPIGQLVIRR